MASVRIDFHFFLIHFSGTHSSSSSFELLILSVFNLVAQPILIPDLSEICCHILTPERSFSGGEPALQSCQLWSTGTDDVAGQRGVEVRTFVQETGVHVGTSHFLNLRDRS